MKAIALGLIEDLRAKRLWPVAVLLLITLLAVPVVLLKPSEEVPAAPATPAADATSAPDGLPSPEQALAGESGNSLVTLAGLRRPSTLGSFASKNPFRPLQRLDGSTDTALALAQTADSGGAAAPTDSDGSTGGGGGTGGDGSGGGSRVQAADRDCPDFDSQGEAQRYFESRGGPDSDPNRLDADGDGRACESLPCPCGSGGGGPQPKPLPPATDPEEQPGPDPEPAPEQRLTFAVDLTFDGPDSHPRRYRNLPRLSMLPAPEAPLLVFLGVGDEANSAVFLVDSTLQAASGDATCTPSPTECATLAIEPGEQQTFTDVQGGEYFLQIDQIREVPVERAERAARAREARATVGVEEPVRRFALPSLIDFLVIGGQE